MQWEFRPKSVSSSPASPPAAAAATSPSSATRADHTLCPEKEWLSPPVSPRSADLDGLESAHDNDYDFGNAFVEWAY